MFVPGFFGLLLCGFACYGLLCLVEEFACWLRDKQRKSLPIRLVLLFRDNEESVEWFVRRLSRVLCMEGKIKVDEVQLVDVGSHDNTPLILAKLSGKHHLFGWGMADPDSLLSKAGDALVVDCRNADWAACLKRIKAVVGDQGTENGGLGAGNWES